MSETQLKDKVMDYMRQRGIFCMKIAGGPRQAAGIADILAVVPPAGFFLAIELKAPGKPPWPTALQARFLDNVQKAGGMSACLNDFNDAVSFIESCLSYAQAHSN